jgi:Fe-S cluster biosynthesis and repair protein YggX
MSETLECARCRKHAAALTSPPVPGPAGLEVLERVCVECWGEWNRTEVMVINELKLNFMDPKSQQILTQHMREFLCLDGQEPSVPFPPPDGDAADE